MTIPDFDARGNLKPGVHDATLGEVRRRFGSTPARRALLEGLRRALRALRVAGCDTAYIDGSFITSKPDPADYDGCYDDANLDTTKLDPVFKDFSNKRAAQEAKYSGEFFPANMPADKIGRTFTEFFQTDRDGNRKGLVRIDLRRLR